MHITFIIQFDSFFALIQIYLIKGALLSFVLIDTNLNNIKILVNIRFFIVHALYFFTIKYKLK